MILRTAFIDKFVKSIERERHRTVAGVGQPVPFLAQFTHATTDNVDLAKAEKDKKS